jgi:hypothetical protein
VLVRLGVFGSSASARSKCCRASSRRRLDLRQAVVLGSQQKGQDQNCPRRPQVATLSLETCDCKDLPKHRRQTHFPVRLFGFLVALPGRNPGKCSQALHIQSDRVHIVAKMNKTLDRVRATKSRRLACDDHSLLLSESRCCVLKRNAKPIA